MTPTKLKEYMTQLQKLLDILFTHPSAFTWGDPLLFIKKKDDSLRMSINYKDLNKVTFRKKHPLPLIDDLFEKFQGASILSKINLMLGYHQLKI